MSLNATSLIAGWTAVGTATAGALRPITSQYLTGLTPHQGLIAPIRVRPDSAPRPPPGLVAGQTVTTAVLFGLLAWRFGPHLELLGYSYLAAVAVPLSVIDMLEMRLPRQLVLPLYPACLGLFGVAAAGNDDGARFMRAVTGMVLLLAAYLVIAVWSRGGLGAGDVRLAGPIGFALTWLDWSALFAGSLFSLLCAAAIATSSPNTGDSLLRREFPFGPAMFAGTFLALLTL